MSAPASKKIFICAEKFLCAPKKACALQHTVDLSRLYHAFAQK